MRSIRTKLSISFLVIIGILLALGFLFAIMHLTLIKQYRDVTTNMIGEHRLTEVSTELVNLFIPFAKSVNDKTLQTQYDTLRAQIAALFSNLDVATMNKASRVAYLGLKSTINALLAEIDAGITAVKKGDVSGIGATYDAALRQSYFATANTGTLILSDLQYTEQLQEIIAKNELVGEVIGGALFLLAAAGAAIYSLSFSRQLVAPLGKLTKLAKDVAGGNLDLSVDRDLLDEKDEVGSLAQSFDVMMQSLRSTIRALDTEKKGVEKKIIQRTRELQEEQAQLIASINSLPLGFFLINPQGAVILSNQAAAQIIPQNAKSLDVIGSIFSPAFDSETITGSIKKEGAFKLAEAKLRNEFFSIIATPVFLSRPSGGNEIIGMVLLIEDITAKKRLEESKDSFLAIAAHEMRTPLTIIRGNTELILENRTIRDGGIRSQLESVLRSAVRLLGIVNDFLDVQNMEAGRVALSFEPVDIREVLQKTINDLLPLANQKGLSITLDVPLSFSLPKLRLDQFRLQQIYVNIISNAIHYTDRGGITVSIGEENKTVNVRFSDTGIGISADEQTRLFNKFETGQVFVRSQEYGSGLGLYISRFLARLMGGDLVLERSEIGKGSTFRLTFSIL